MMETICGWAFLKVEIFSNLLWKNVRRLNSFDTTHLKIWRDMHEKDENSEFIKAVGDFIDIPGLVTWKERRKCEMTDKLLNGNNCSNNFNGTYHSNAASVNNIPLLQDPRNASQVQTVHDSVRSMEVFKVLKQRLDNVINVVLNGKSHTGHEFSQLCQDNQVKYDHTDVRMKTLKQCIQFKQAVQEFEKNCPESELMNKIGQLYVDVVDDILQICGKEIAETSDVLRSKHKGANSEQNKDGNNAQHRSMFQPGIVHKQETTKGRTKNKEEKPPITREDTEIDAETKYASLSINDSLESLDQLHLYRSLYQFPASPLTLKEDIANIFLFAAKEVSGLLEQHMDKYRLETLHVGSPSSNSWHPVGISTAIKNGTTLKSIRIPIMMPHNSPKTYTFMRKVQHKKVCHLWYPDISYLEKDNSPVPAATKTMQHKDEESETDSDVQIVLPLFDVAPYFEKNVQLESPSTWLPSIDKRFYCSLIGSDKRRKSKRTQERFASPVNTHCDNRSQDATAGQLSTVVSRKNSTHRPIFTLSKDHQECDNSSCSAAADMAGGDGSTCAPKAIRRCLWETDGSNGDNEDKTIYTEDILSSKSIYSTTCWNNKDVEKGFISAFDLFGAPKYFKSPNQLLKFKNKIAKSPGQIKMSDSIKALKKLQKQFADRDVNTKDSLQHAKPSNVQKPQPLPTQSSDYVWSTLNSHLTSIKQNNKTSQHGDTKQPHEENNMNYDQEDWKTQPNQYIHNRQSDREPNKNFDQDDLNKHDQYNHATHMNKNNEEFIDACLDIPEQDYYCIDTNEDLWDEPINVDFEFGSNGDFALDDNFPGDAVEPQEGNPWPDGEYEEDYNGEYSSVNPEVCQQWSDGGYTECIQTTDPNMQQVSECNQTNNCVFADGYPEWSENDNTDYDPSADPNMQQGLESNVAYNYEYADTHHQCQPSAYSNTEQGKQNPIQTMPQRGGNHIHNGEMWTQPVVQPATTVYPLQNNWPLQVVTNGNEPEEPSIPKEVPSADFTVEVPHIPSALQANNAYLTYTQNIRMTQQMQPNLPYGFVQGPNVPQYQAYAYPFIPVPQGYLPSQMCGQPQYTLPFVPNHLGGNYNGAVYQHNFSNIDHLRPQHPLLPQMPVIHTPQPSIGNHVMPGMTQPGIYNQLRQ